MRLERSPGVLAALSIALALWAAGPASAHDGGSLSSLEGDGTYTWRASGGVDSPANAATFTGGAQNITVTSTATHYVEVNGPANAGFSVTYHLWLENDQQGVGSQRTATNLALNLDGNGYWQRLGERSGVASSVAVGSHYAVAWADVVVASAMNYAVIPHEHSYTIDP